VTSQGKTTDLRPSSDFQIVSTCAQLRLAFYQNVFEPLADLVVTVSCFNILEGRWEEPEVTFIVSKLRFGCYSPVRTGSALQK
jgi:hypothetical protein